MFLKSQCRFLVIATGLSASLLAHGENTYRVTEPNVGLMRISELTLGHRRYWRELAWLNGKTKPYTVYLGETLRLPEIAVKADAAANPPQSEFIVVRPTQEDGDAPAAELSDHDAAATVAKLQALAPESLITQNNDTAQEYLDAMRRSVAQGDVAATQKLARELVDNFPHYSQVPFVGSYLAEQP